MATSVAGGNINLKRCWRNANLRPHSYRAAATVALLLVSCSTSWSVALGQTTTTVASPMASSGPTAPPSTSSTTASSTSWSCNSTVLRDAGYRVVPISGDAEELIPVYYQVPLYQQSTNYSCGPASLYAALGAFGLMPSTPPRTNVTASQAVEMQIAAFVNTTEENGTGTQDLTRGARHFGLAAKGQNQMSFNDVHRALWRGGLVIVCYELCRDNTSIPWPISYDNGHYSVIWGLDQRNVYLMDPWSGRHGYVPRAQWYAQWHCGGDLSSDGSLVLQRWGMTVQAPLSGVGGSATPSSSSLINVLKEVSLLEQPPVFQVSECPGDIP